MSKASSPILLIAKYTLTDDIRQKSFIVMCVLCALGILLVRGCYSGQVMVNGRMLDAESAIRAMSGVMFHLISVGSMCLAALLAMRVMKRDRDEGVQALLLSKPITRMQYVAGKVLGLWALSVLFMFVLHGLVFIIASLGMGTLLLQYLAASLVCFLNLLFVVAAVLLFSLWMPDIMTFLCVTGIGIISFTADGIYALSRSAMGQAMMQPSGAESTTSGWTVFYWLWPQISGTQRFAASLTAGEGLPGFLSLYPPINVLVYFLILCALLLWLFGREDIA